MDSLDTALLALARGEPMAVATVIRAAGSSPRHAGATMWVHDDGRTVGTIGGGRIEHDVTQIGVRVARGAPAQRVVRHLVRDLGMCCGGSMEIYVEPAAQSERALRAIAQAMRVREPILLVTPLDGSPKQVLPWDAAASQTRPSLVGEAFHEPIRPAPRLLVFGAGHVGRALGPLAASIGFEVVLCDDGEATAAEETPSWASLHVPSFEVGDVERALGTLGGDDFAVVVTRDHAIDQRILERLLPREELGYLGLIGSRAKLARFRRRLEAKGLWTESRSARLHAPIGLDIGAETPEEIAVAIAAELIAVRRAR